MKAFCRYAVAVLLVLGWCLGKTDAAAAQETGAVTPAIMPGTKTIVRRPEGGLPYYIRMSPKASKHKPSRLIVWLHPSGQSVNQAPESLIKQIFHNGYALLLPSEKAWEHWSDDDARRLFTKSLPDAGTLDGIDAKKPILMGFSAGGQMALRAWREKPEELGGLLIDVAYPVEVHPNGMTTFDPPKSPAIKNVPIYVVAGEDDGGGPEIWRRVEPDWRKQGVPLTVHIVPHKGHQWLTDAAILESYLKMVATGSLQNDKTAAKKVGKTAIAKRPKPKPATTTDEDFRTWTDATGSHKTEAKYVGMDDKNVKLERRDGIVVHVPLEKLSEADQRYAKTRRTTTSTQGP
jgi:dienelactone hydrolase